MAAKPKKKANLVVYLILGLLVFSLGGFGIANFGGSQRAVAAVGDTEVSVTEYALALQSALRARQAQGEAISLASPRGEALAQSVQRQLIGAAALEGETARLGISVSDASVRAELVATQAFMGPDGKFDRDTYAFALRGAGLTEAEYEESIRTDAATALTTEAVLSAAQQSQTMIDTLVAYAGERRDILWLRLDAAALPEPLPEPSEAELRAAYEADPATYTEPAKKRLTYVALTPESMLSEITVEESDLRALYAERADQYNRPERRLVERLVMPDLAAAEAAFAALTDGAKSFEDLVAERGLTLGDIDLGDVTEAELGEAGASVFALPGPGIAGPVETFLGPAIYRVNAVLAAQVTPFEEVRDVLTDELAMDRARRAIAGRREQIDDLLASGATLEEIAAETPMELGTMEFGPDSADGIAAYAGFRDAANRVTVDDFPELIELEDGGLVALRLDALLDPALLPFEEVADRVRENWIAAETLARLTALAETVREARAAGESFAAQGYQPTARPDLSRDSYLDGAPEGLVGAVFDLAPGETAALQGEGEVHVVELTGVNPVDPASPEAQALAKTVSDSLANTLRQDLIDSFVSALEAEAGITRNQAAINAVHTQFP